MNEEAIKGITIEIIANMWDEVILSDVRFIAFTRVVLELIVFERLICLKFGRKLLESFYIDP